MNTYNKSNITKAMELQKLNTSLQRIENWFYTYAYSPYDGSNGFGGPIATYWSSSNIKIGPYPLTSCGLIRGLNNRKNSPNSDIAKKRIEPLLEFFLKTQDKTSGIYYSGWGEDGFTQPGLIQQSSILSAIYEYLLTWGEDRELIQSANLGWNACFQFSTLNRGFKISNQALRFCEATIFKSLVLDNNPEKEKTLKIATDIAKSIIENQFSNHQFLGAFPQGKWNHSIIFPYQGKCISPLIEIYKATKNEFILDSAIKLIDYIIKHSSENDDYFLINGSIIPKLNKSNNYLLKFRHIFPFFEEKLHKLYKESIFEWSSYQYPYWIARSADTTNGIYQAGKVLGSSKFLNFSHQMVNEILKYQTEIGGIQNTIGFFGYASSLPFWQDVLPIPRWNSYVIQLLNQIVSSEPVKSPEEIKEKSLNIKIVDGELFEDKEKVVLYLDNGKIKWSYVKNKRWGVNNHMIEKWDEKAFANG